MLQEMIWRGRAPQGDAELTAVLVACTLRVLLASLAGAATPSSLTLDVGLGFLSAEVGGLLARVRTSPPCMPHMSWPHMLGVHLSADQLIPHT